MHKQAINRLYIAQLLAPTNLAEVRTIFFLPFGIVILFFVCALQLFKRLDKIILLVYLKR